MFIDKKKVYILKNTVHFITKKPNKKCKFITLNQRNQKPKTNMKANILVVGASGTGKSSSIRNLDVEKTIILNTEQKALPFRAANKFKMNVSIPDIGTFLGQMNTKGEFVEGAFNKAIRSEKAEVVIVESLTSLTEQILKEAKRKYTGFDIWDNFKTTVEDILHRSKNTNKCLIMTGIDMVLEGANGVEERYFAIDGSWKKKVEKEFVIVLYTTVITDENGKTKYVFITNKQQGYEKFPCKSPDGMLPPIMDNDLSEVIRLCEEYYNGDEESTNN